MTPDNKLGEKLNKVIYKYKSGEGNVKSEAEGFYFIESIPIIQALEKTGEVPMETISTRYQGMEYAEKTCPLAECIAAVNIVKRLIMTILKLSPFFTPLLVFSLNKSFRNKLFDAFNDIGMKAMGGFILNPQFMSPMARELQIFIDYFLKGLDINNSLQTAEILSNIIDYDNAYRYRLQDLFNETNKEELRKTKTIKKLLEIESQREAQHGIMVSRKFKLFSNVLTIFLYIPKVRKSFNNALDKIEYKNLLPDEQDKFWMCVRKGYNFFGKTDQERYMMINHLKVVKPLKKL